MPRERWADNQLTPLCTACDRRRWDCCHSCRQIPCMTPPAHDGPKSSLAGEGGSSPRHRWPNLLSCSKGWATLPGSGADDGSSSSQGEPEPKGPPIAAKSAQKAKSAPAACYYRSDPADHPRAQPRAVPAAAQRCVDPRPDVVLQEEDLIASCGSCCCSAVRGSAARCGSARRRSDRVPTEDPIEDF